MKNNRKFIPVLMLPALMLAACSSEVVSKPTDYEDKLVVDAGQSTLGSDAYNNIKSIIYDAMREGGTVSSDVLNEVLLQFAISVVGDYTKLQEVAAKIDDSYTQNSDVDAFVEAHKSYWVLDSNGERKTDADSKKKEYARVKYMLERIEKRIAQAMYDKISSSYTRDGYFYEEDFLMSLRNTIKNVANPAEVNAQLHNRYLVVPEMQDFEVFSYEWEDTTKLPGLLTRALYEDAEKGYNYISNEIIPDLYRNLLVEQYLFDNSYNTLGRAYARKVNAITITSNTDYPLLARNLMNAYVDTYINTDDADLAKSAEFSYISKAWRGVDVPATGAADSDKDLDRAAYLLKTAGSEYVSYTDTDGFTGKTYNYWAGTSYGGMIEKLKKINKDPLLNDSSAESEFTNSGAYTVAQGVDAKTVTIQKEDYTISDWGIKNGGLSGISNSDARKRLFNIGVANALDKDTYPDRFAEDGTYSISDDEGGYVAKIHGRYFLKPLTSERKEDADYTKVDERLRDMVWYDSSSSTYTIIEITEAVSSSKLAKTSDKNYETVYGGLEGFAKQELIAHEVAEQIASSESYKTLSTKYWLEESAMAYHDTVIYDYFVSNYPDLFD